MPELSIKPAEQSLTTLEFLQRRIPTAPTGFLRQLLKRGKVRGRNGPLHAEQHLNEETRLTLPDSGRVRELLSLPGTASTGVSILYESREILVVDKPAGLATHAGVGHEHDHLVGRVAAFLKERGDRFMVAPAQRLDLETSGPVLFGKGKHACAELGRMLMRHEIEKDYLALADGELYGDRALSSTVPAKGKLKEALTDLQVVARSGAGTLVRLRLHSGRQHQIRRQLAEIGHPLFGDRRYGGPCPPELPRLFLHCCRLALIDPFSGAPLEFTPPLPPELGDFLRRIVPHAPLDAGY